MVLIVGFDFDFDFGFGFDFGVEPGNGARGKGAAFEPPCLAQRLRSLPPVRFQCGVWVALFFSRALVQLFKELVLGLLHAPCGFRITHESGDAFIPAHNNRRLPALCRAILLSMLDVVGRRV